MKLLMDADCLIKLTKAGLKELVVLKCDVFIPEPVKRDVVDAGKKKECSDAFAVEKNIESNLIAVIDAPAMVEKGDQALIALYKKDAHDAVSTQFPHKIFETGVNLPAQLNACHVKCEAYLTVA